MGTTTKPGRRGVLTQLFCLPQAFCNGVFVNFEQKCHISHINASEALSTKEFHCFHHSLHPSRHLSHALTPLYKGVSKELVRDDSSRLLNHDKERTWRVMCDIFNELGYDVKFRVLNSCDYGIPQHRERVYLSWL